MSDAFKVSKDGKQYDYRLGSKLDVQAVRTFLEAKGYKVVLLGDDTRHMIGRLSKDGSPYLFKLATTPGMSIITENEAHWNDLYNQTVPREKSQFWVPRNHETGYFKPDLYYLITDMFFGTLLAKRPASGLDLKLLNENLDRVIDMALSIQQLQLPDLINREVNDAQKHTEFFISKAQAWFDAIPETVRQQYHVQKLLDLAISHAHELNQAPRHGDYAPWHIMLLENGKLGLIDGEHALTNGVELYDIGYFIERTFHVLERPDIAEEIIKRLILKGVDMSKLQIVMAARAIGAFLDKSLGESPEFRFTDRFARFVLDRKDW